MNTPVIRRNRETPWTPLAPGIEMQIFHADEKNGVWTVKIHMHAGSTLPSSEQIVGYRGPLPRNKADIRAAAANVRSVRNSVIRNYRDSNLV